MAEGRILTDVEGPVVTLTIDRPHRANALTPGLCDELRQAVEAVDPVDGHRVTVLRSMGGRAFCGGFDLGHLRSDIDDTPLRQLMRSIQQASCPVVAVLDGAAVGAGFELACSSDVRVGLRGVQIGVPAVRLGVPYAIDGIATMVRTHPGIAHLLTTGEMVRIDELPGFAVVAPRAEFAERLDTVIRGLSEASPEAVAYTRRAVRWALGLTDEERSALVATGAAVLAGADLEATAAAHGGGQAEEDSGG